MSETLDLRLIVRPLDGAPKDQYYVALAAAPAGFRTTELKFWPLSGQVCQWKDIAVTLDPLNVMGQSRQVRQRLFELLFPPDSRAVAELRQLCASFQQGSTTKGARLRLYLDLPSNLAGKPWEDMVCPDDEQYQVIAQAKIAVFRYVAEYGDGSGSPRDAKRAILVIRAHPFDVTPNVAKSLNLELKRIRSAEARTAGAFTFKYVQGSETRQQIQDALSFFMHGNYTLSGIHFMGHGIAAKGLPIGFCGESDDDTLDIIHAQDIIDMLRSRDAVEQWIVVNACHSAGIPSEAPLAAFGAQLAARLNVPYVIGHNLEVETFAAHEFGGRFFDAVVVGNQPVDDFVEVEQLASRGRRPVIFARYRRTPPADERVARDEQQLKKKVEEQSSPFETPPIIPSGMVWIPAGPFKTGLSQTQVTALFHSFSRYNLSIDAAKEALTAEEEGTDDLVSGAAMDIHPVTIDQFKSFIAATHYVTQAERLGRRPTWKDVAIARDHPIVCVTIVDAMAYCTWAKRRLPTAQEWKKAARGADGRIYPWGEVFSPSKCNGGESGNSGTTPVTAYDAVDSPYGCKDLVGNVEEWTGSKVGDLYCIFGGSYQMTCEVYGLPVFHRLAQSDYCDEALGFRCVYHTR